MPKEKLFSKLCNFTFVSPHDVVKVVLFATGRLSISINMIVYNKCSQNNQKWEDLRAVSLGKAGNTEFTLFIDSSQHLI